MPTPEEAASRSLARTIAEARQRSGYDQAALAEAAGLARVTLRELELGRDPRASTLQALLDALPELSPGDLLPSARTAPPPACSTIWKLTARAQGFVTRRLRRSVRFAEDESAELIVEHLGVRPLGRTSDTRGAALDALCCIAAGSPRLLDRLTEGMPERPGSSLRIEEEGTCHELRVSADLRRTGFDHVLRRSLDAAPLQSDERPHDPVRLLDLGLAWAVEYAVERLDLQVRLPPAAEDRHPLLVGWPTPMVADPTAGALAVPGVAGATLSSSGARLRAVIEKPHPGLTLALGWRDQPVRREETASTDLAGALQRARTDCELSRRALAERMGVSAMTVVEAERGRDLRRSTLLKWLAALPDLSPWSLLSFAGPASPRAAWSHGVAVHGCLADAETKSVRVSAEGHSSLSIATENFRRTRPERGELRVRLGRGHSVLDAGHATLSGVDVADDDALERLRISRIATPSGEPHHELRIPESLANDGVSYTRRLEHRGVYTMTAERGRELTGSSGPFHEGASFAAPVPTRLLRLVLRLPSGWWPEDFRTHCFPIGRAPDPERQDAMPILHPGGLPIDIDRRRRRVVLEVEHPLIGFKYALSWRLP